MTVKTIKGVNDEDWREFKTLAAQSGVKVGKMFKALLENYKKEQDKIWGSILNKEKLLSDEDARKMRASLSTLRKEKGFRI